MAEEITDSPVDWVAEHARSYLASDGAQGHRWRGQDTLLLVTRGRVSGKLRRTALIYGMDDGRYIVVASNGGSARDPDWCLNLKADAHVQVQVGAEHFEAAARPANEHERPALWQLMAAKFPHYEGMQGKTKRTIPVVIIEPAR